jgi:16S rRNA (cytosine1402-N4)-methyltransferase
MRLDPTSPITAAELVNTLSPKELTRILKEWGEERFAQAIAQKIVQERTLEPIETTTRLAEITRAVAATWHGPRPSIDPATKTFQALRIAVNDELGRLASLLESVERAAKALSKIQGSALGGATLAGTAQEKPRPWLAPGARVGIIAFHSLEDRPVKQTFASMLEQGLVKSLTKKPVEAGEEERSANPRSRSAKLRACRVGT